MRGSRRKPHQADGLGLARIITLLAALAAGGITYASVQTLGQLVLQQHKGVAAAGAGAAVASGAGWKETWRLASELGAGEAAQTSIALDNFVSICFAGRSDTPASQNVTLKVSDANRSEPRAVLEFALLTQRDRSHGVAVSVSMLKSHVLSTTLRCNEAYAYLRHDPPLNANST